MKMARPRAHGAAWAGGIALVMLILGGAAVALVPRPVSSSPPRIVSDGTAAGGDACAGCHGPSGEGSPDGSFPRLAGLDADYLFRQLRDYASGRRRHPVMEPIARRLSEQEARSAARWFAGATAAPRARPAVDPRLLAEGEAIAAIGRWERNIPPCSSCHGATGLGTGDNFPALAGQSPEYLKAQINAWRLGWRRNDPMGLMRNVANYLTGPEIEAVAAYYASLPPPPPSEEAGR